MMFVWVSTYCSRLLCLFVFAMCVCISLGLFALYTACVYYVSFMFTVLCLYSLCLCDIVITWHESSGWFVPENATEKRGHADRPANIRTQANRCATGAHDAA